MLSGIGGRPQVLTTFAQQAGGSSITGAAFPDISVSVSTDPSKPVSTGDGKDGNRATAAAATAAANDLDILKKLHDGLGNNANEAFGVETLNSAGQALSGASFDKNGDLSVFGTGSVGGATSNINMDLSAGNSGASWAARTSGELARASYELTSLIGQTDPNASRSSVDQVA